MNVHSVSIKGLREQNEDKHIVLLNSDNKDPQQNPVNFFAIFDGHGGKEISKHMNETVTPHFMGKQVAYPLSKKYVYTLYDNIQKELKTIPASNSSGTTALVVVNFKTGDDHYINVINLGDCRCIICRDNFAMPLTKDHKPNWPEERHRIEKIGGTITFDGTDFRIKDLSVSRAFGDVDAAPFVTYKPDVFRYKLDKNDKFLVMACDGLWDVLANWEVTNFVLLQCYDNTTKNRINKNVNIAKKLAEMALQKGSSDNITVIVIFLKGESST